MKQDFDYYQAALYMRVSKDDNHINESMSITTQRKILQRFAKENQFFIYDEYIDDGWSGTNFERPNFKRMIQDIEDKKVNLVITKDLSRLGRDYIVTGQYTEIYFPSKKVRYIAINDGYDSYNFNTDIAIFKNVINEIYARDTSRKIRSALIAKMQEGCFIGNFAPYGYKKDPTNKNHLLIDNKTAPIVREIFDMAKNRKNPAQIAAYLNDQKIPAPAIYRCQNYPYLNLDQYSKYKKWTASTISKMLHNIVYLGHLAQGKTTKISFKSSIIIQNRSKDWIIAENTHTPIVSKETFDFVSKCICERTCYKQKKFQNIFSNIAKCADCGKNMSTVGTRKKGSFANLACGSYKLYGKSKCSNHFIDYNILYNVILESIKKQNFLLNLKDKEQTMLQKREYFLKLTPEILFRLIKTIKIYQGYYKKTESGKKKHQAIQIFFLFSDNIK